MGGGGGVNILYHNILTPHPLKRNVNHWIVLYVICKCFCDAAKLSLDYIYKIPFLNICWRVGRGGGGGGVNILYHNILIPPPPINQKCQPWTRIVCDIYMFWVMKLSWHCIPLSKYLSLIFGGGGVNILYHNILTPTPPELNLSYQHWYCAIKDL